MNNNRTQQHFVLSDSTKSIFNQNIWAGSLFIIFWSSKGKSVYLCCNQRNDKNKYETIQLHIPLLVDFSRFAIMWLYPLRCMFISDTIPTAHLLIILLNILLIGIQATNVITAYRKESTRLEIIMLAFVLSTCITWITYLLGYIDFIVGGWK